MQQITVLLIVWILNFQTFDTEYKILHDILPELIELTDLEINIPQTPEYYIEDSLLNDKHLRHLNFDDIEDEELREIARTLKGAKAIVFDLLNHYTLSDQFWAFAGREAARLPMVTWLRK